MKCPKCKTTMIDKCCPRCGYLESGATVSLKDKPEKFIDEKNFNSDFDKLYRNSNNFFPLIFTGYYIAYHKYFLSGLIVILLKWLGIFGIAYYFSNIPFICEYTGVLIFTFLVFYHMFIGAIANTIILFCDKRKIEKIKKKHPKDYAKYLYKNSSTSILPILLIILFYIALFIYLRIR